MPFVKVPKKREPLWKQHDQLAQKEGLRHAVYETNGSKYVGEWKDNMKHGKGEQHYSQTDQLYDGDWAFGKRNGFGTLSKLDKKIYVGGWKDDKRSGKGMNYFSDSEFYDGEWECGKRCGWGRMTFSDGSTYEGEWFDDKQNGQGLLMLANGNHFEGEFRDGKKNGHGTFFYRVTAQIYKGVWKEDIPKCGEFMDMDRDAAPRCTQYAMPSIELKDAKKVLTDASLDYLRQ